MKKLLFISLLLFCTTSFSNTIFNVEDCDFGDKNNNIYGPVNEVYFVTDVEFSANVSFGCPDSVRVSTQKYLNTVLSLTKSGDYQNGDVQVCNYTNLSEEISLMCRYY